MWWRAGRSCLISWLIVVFLLACGCSRTRVLGPGPDGLPGVRTDLVMDSLAASDWLRYKSVRIRLLDGSRSSSSFVRLQDDRLVWRPRDGNPFHKAPLRQERLERVHSLERVHRLLPALGGMAVGIMLGAKLAHDMVPNGDGSESLAYALYLEAPLAVAGGGLVLLAGGGGSLSGGLLGFHDRLLIQPTSRELELLNRQPLPGRNLAEEEKPSWP